MKIFGGKEMKTKILKMVAVTSLVAGMFAGCTQPKTSTAETNDKLSVDKLVVTYVTSPLNVPSVIEKENHVFADNLKDVDIEYAEITSGADQSQALASGDVQILHAIGGSSVIAAAAGGADIKILNMYSRAPEAFALYSSNDSLNSPESLKGKTIAGPAGTNLHELLVAYLKKGNLTIDDVNFVSMSIPDARAALEAGSIDVAMLGGPAAYNADKSGLHKVKDGKGLIEAIICVATTQKFYDEHKDVIDAFMNAQKQLRTFMQDNPKETKEIVEKVLELDDEAYEAMYGQYDFSLEVSQSDINGLQKTADFMYENGMIQTQVDASSLFIQQ